MWKNFSRWGKIYGTTVCNAKNGSRKYLAFLFIFFYAEQCTEFKIQWRQDVLLSVIFSPFCRVSVLWSEPIRTGCSVSFPSRTLTNTASLWEDRHANRNFVRSQVEMLKRPRCVLWKATVTLFYTCAVSVRLWSTCWRATLAPGCWVCLWQSRMQVLWWATFKFFTQRLFHMKFSRHVLTE